MSYNFCGFGIWCFGLVRGMGGSVILGLVRLELNGLEGELDLNGGGVGFFCVIVFLCLSMLFVVG